MDTQELVATYMAAWNERDAEKRRALLNKCWADSGTYVDPLSDIAGRDALDATIEGFQQQMPEASLVLTSGTDQHHNHIRFGWKLEKGFQPMEGIDVGIIDGDGKLESIVGFWGANPPA